MSVNVTGGILPRTWFVALVVAIIGSHAQGQAPADDPDFAMWVVRVQYMHRADAVVDKARMEQLTSKLDAATTPAEKRKAQREIDKARADAEKARGFVIYGWSMIADAEGKPIRQTQSMMGFMLPATAENAAAMKALANAEAPALAIKRDGSADLVSIFGRRWCRAERAAVIKPPADLREPGAFPDPPDKPATDEQRQSIATSLKFHSKKPQQIDGAPGGASHRFTMSIACDAGPQNASTLHAWVLVHLNINGQAVGPIVDHVEVPRGQSGAFSISRSFDVITRRQATLDPTSATAELAAVRWE
jgi:hypothetical protein